MIQVIVNRRSIGKYKADTLPQSLIEEIIKAGTLAPSSRNLDNISFAYDA
ncbi:MAG: nitroreductase family protein [Lachnospiraceae bacterium]